MPCFACQEVLTVVAASWTEPNVMSRITVQSHNIMSNRTKACEHSKPYTMYFKS
jgi:hypothetical protein